jgi:hypothetical protein
MDINWAEEKKVSFIYLFPKYCLDRECKSPVGVLGLIGGIILKFFY